MTYVHALDSTAGVVENRVLFHWGDYRRCVPFKTRPPEIQIRSWCAKQYILEILQGPSQYSKYQYSDFRHYILNVLGDT